MQPFDAIVVGAGAMGAATCWRLALRRQRVLGIEQFDLAHARGSSHGQTRICRKAYFEHPDYVPLLHRAYDFWDELEALSGRDLFHRAGLVLCGRPDSQTIRGVRRATELHHLDVREWTREEARRKAPGLAPAPDMDILFEPDAGYLRVEDCVRAMIDAASRAGAVIQPRETVREWSADEGGVRVVTSAGVYTAKKLVITAGAWSSRLLKEEGLRLEVRRKPQFWFAASAAEHAESSGRPVFAFDLGDAFYYGFPAIQGRMKVAEHLGREVVDSPDSLDRTIRPCEGEGVRRFLAEFVPGVEGEIVDASVCMYTMSPDHHFIVDRSAIHPRVCYAAGFSGHGFKFAPLIGEALTDLALAGRSNLPIGFLSARRFGRD